MVGYQCWCAFIATTVVAASETIKAVAAARRRFVQACPPQLLVMRSWVMLAELIGLVEGTLPPQSVESPLPDPAACPAKPHAHCLGPFLFDGTIGNASCRIVAGFNNSRGLWVAHFLERCSDRAGFFVVVEESTKFGLGH
jgi:hypothetical protein